MAQFTIRTTLIASFGTLAAIAVFLGGTTFMATEAGDGRLDAEQVAFVEALARVEGELTSAVADLVARNDTAWPATLDQAFQGFADAAGGTDITAVSDQVNGLLQSGQALRQQWPAAVRGDAVAIESASRAYRSSTASIHELETRLVGDRMAAGAESTATAGLIRTLAIGGAVLAVGIAGFACWSCMHTILGPLRKAEHVVHQAASGNLAVRIGGATGGGELGTLSDGIDRLLDAAHGAIHGVTEESFKLAASATSLAASARTLTQGVETLADDAALAAGSAESVTSSVTTMAASSERITTNLQSVAASATQLTTSIQEIDDHATTASAAAGDAAALAAGSTDSLAQLGSAADEIGTVLEVIRDIAEQANLLALNATIEATRAGHAGRGFAVVATEARELAGLTADLTEDIRQRIEAIRASAGASVEAIGRITDVITGISSVTGTIATAIREHAGATQEIVRHASESVAAAEIVSRDLARAAGTSEEVSRTITSVDRNTRTSVDSLLAIQSASQDVIEMAEALDGQVRPFQV